LRKTILLNKGKLTDKEKEELNKVFELYIHHGIKFNTKMNKLYMADLEGMIPEERENIIFQIQNKLFNENNENEKILVIASDEENAIII